MKSAKEMLEMIAAGKGSSAFDYFLPTSFSSSEEVVLLRVRKFGIIAHVGESVLSSELCCRYADEKICCYC